ncbi:hypothetical protein NLJ89_g5043 [Agrocybe chaxingu]|uniref:Uncharacterized protein n=1 Tax=Agrocybe chaxingu TaxID=84603 RepID=A0A9W8K1D6_9AGAR|nr:hypothetical protein NLJ89_g5043 [Agrocybe chaxingu]
MEHDASDILGQRTIPLAPGSQPAKSSYSTTKLVFIALGLLVLYSIAIRLWRRVLLWRERSYKLATRRRHGIPDSDLRPFNVAYTDAVMKAREEENRNRTDLRHKPVFRPQPSTLDQREAFPEHILRQRSAVAQRSDVGMRSTAVPVPGAYSSGSFDSHQPPRLHEINTKGHQTRSPYVQPVVNGVKPLSRHGGYLNIDDATSDNEARKRTWDETLEEEHEAKKTRVEGEELIDGDEDAEFEEAAPKRGSKRGIRDEEDSEEVNESKKARGKRARKVSQEKAAHHYQGDQSMDVDEEEEADEITELKSNFRGKKRDRAEAGSTFGGDDDDDSAAEREAEGNSKVRKGRKRRTVAKRKSEASYIRGKKRERGQEDGGSDSDDSFPNKKSSRKKKGKRASHIEHRDSKSDISIDESTTSTKKGREIGEEWESNNVKYKIGPNGQKLRLTLVKKARQKFVMPQDSQHPDRDANLQVFIECWLTDEEYQSAKAEGMLHWQDSPGKSKDTEKLSLDISQAEHGVPFPQPSAGKNLLWSTSTSATTPTMSSASQSPVVDSYPAEKYRNYRGSYRHSIATSVGLPINAFGASMSTVPTIKRIASTTRVLGLNSSISGSPGLSDSTNGSPRTPQSHKVFSKWEKQELEAKAMMKMREATRKKELEKEAKLKEEKDRAERAAAERAKAEQERQQRERQERERLEQERAAKAEADRKAKENMSVPSITVTAPSTDNVLGGGAAPAAAPSQPVPNFFNNFTNPPKPAAAAPAAGPTTSSGQSSTTPNFFSSPASSAPAASQEQARPTSGFSAPASGSAFSASTASSSAPKSFFSFNNPSSSAVGMEQKKDGTPASSGTGAAGASFMSRIGPQAGSEAPKTQAQGPSTFSFAKPESSSSSAAPANAFSSSSTTNAPGATTTPKFSFGVKPAATTTTPASNAFAAPSSSSLSGALGADASKPAASSSGTANTGFSFKVPSTPASAPTANGTAGASSTTPAGVPKFSFAAPSAFGGVTASKNAESAKQSPFGTTGTTSSSPFGNTTTTSAFGTTPATTNNAAAPSPFGTTSNFSGSNPSSFSFGATASKTPSSFGNSTFGTNSVVNGTSSTPFGTSASTSQPANIFGGASTTTKKPAEAPKPLFSFANPTSSTTTATNGTNAAPKSAFNFGTTPATSSNTSNSATTTAASGSGTTSTPFSFNFGAPATTTPQNSPFGAASPGTSMFGGTSGAGSSTTAPASVFGGGAFGAPAPK